MRIPIVMGGASIVGDGVLVEDGADMPRLGYAIRFALATAQAGHPAACVCCTLRGPAADSLIALFRARATGAAPFFTRVVVLASTAGEVAVRAAAEEDVVTKARYRLG